MGQSLLPILKNIVIHNMGKNEKKSFFVSNTKVVVFYAFLDAILVVKLYIMKISSRLLNKMGGKVKYEN